MGDGCIIRMNLTEFFKDFSDLDKLKDYMVVLVSREIKVSKFPNFMIMTELVPPAHIISILTDDKDKEGYEEGYMAMLSRERPATALNVLVMAVLNRKARIILLCSKHEDEYEYLKVLTKFLKKTFKLKTYTCKSYAKLKGNVVIENREEVAEIVEKVSEFLMRNKTMNIARKKAARAELVEQLEDYSRERLYRFCEDKGIDIGIDIKKKKLIKIIVEYLEDNNSSAEELI